MRLLTFFILCLISTLSFGQNNTLFEEGNTLYNLGEFEKALGKYEAIHEDDLNEATEEEYIDVFDTRA